MGTEDVNSELISTDSTTSHDAELLVQIERRLPLIVEAPIDSPELATALSQLATVVGRSAEEPLGTYATLIRAGAFSMRAHILNKQIATAVNEALRADRGDPREHSASHLVPTARSDAFEAIQLAQMLCLRGVAGARWILRDSLNAAGTVLMAEGSVILEELRRFDRAVEDSLPLLMLEWASTIGLASKAAICHLQYARVLLGDRPDAVGREAELHTVRAHEWLNLVPGYVKAITTPVDDGAFENLLRAHTLSISTQCMLSIRSFQNLSRNAPPRFTELGLPLANTIRLVEDTVEEMRSVEAYMPDSYAQNFDDFHQSACDELTDLFSAALDFAPDQERMEDRLEWLSFVRRAAHGLGSQYWAKDTSSYELTALIRDINEEVRGDSDNVPTERLNLSKTLDLLELSYLFTVFGIVLNNLDEPEQERNAEDDDGVQRLLEVIAGTAYWLRNHQVPPSENYLSACIDIFAGGDAALNKLLLDSVEHSHSETFRKVLATDDQEFQLGTPAWAARLYEVASSAITTGLESNVHSVLSDLYDHYHSTAHEVNITPQLRSLLRQLDDHFKFSGSDRVALLHAELNLMHIIGTESETDAEELWNASQRLLTEVSYLGERSEPRFAEAAINGLFYEAVANRRLADTDVHTNPSDIRSLEDILHAMEEIRLSSRVSPAVEELIRWSRDQLLLLYANKESAPPREDLGGDSLEVAPARYLLRVTNIPLEEYRLGVHLIKDRLQSPQWHRDRSLVSLVALAEDWHERLHPDDLLDMVSIAAAAIAEADVNASLALLAIALPLNFVAADAQYSMRAQRLLEAIGSKCLFVLSSNVHLDRYVLTYYLFRADAALNRRASNLTEILDRYNLSFILYLIALAYDYRDETALAAYHCCQLARDYGQFNSCVAWALSTAKHIEEGALGHDCYTQSRLNIESDLTRVFDRANIRHE